MITAKPRFDQAFVQAYAAEGRTERLAKLKIRAARSRTESERRLWKYVYRNYDSILTGTPEVLQRHCDYYEQVITRMHGKRLRWVAKWMRDIFSYEWLKTRIRLGTHELIRRSTLLVCPYCGRNYAHLIDRGGELREARPHLDHWFPRSRYPIVGISLYNLIPACSTCNSTFKNDRAMRLERYHHPYAPGPIAFRFSYWPLSTIDHPDGEVTVVPSGSDAVARLRARHHAAIFRIADSYHYCALEGRKILDVMRISSEHHRKMRLRALGLPLSDPLYGRILSVMVKGEIGDLRSPLGKFRRDVYSQWRQTFPRLGLPVIY